MYRAPLHRRERGWVWRRRGGGRSGGEAGTAPGRSASTGGPRGQRVGREQTAVRRTDRPPREQLHKGRTFGTLPKAELKVVQGKALGASS